MNDNRCTVYVGNIDEKVTEDLLYELFLQMGPLNGVCIPKDHKTGGKRNFAFVKFKQEESVDYSLTMLEDIQLFGRRLNLRRKNGPQSKPEESVYQSTPNSSTPSDARIEAEKMRLYDSRIESEKMHLYDATMMNTSHQDNNQHHQQNMYYNERKNDDYYNSSSNYHHRKHGGDHNGGKGHHHNNSDTPMQQRSFSRNQDSPLWIRDGSADDARMPHKNIGGGRQHHMMAADGRNHGSPLAGRSPVWQGSDSYNHGGGRRMAHQQQHNNPYAPEMYHRRHHPYSSPRFNR